MQSDLSMYYLTYEEIWTSHAKKIGRILATLDAWEPACEIA